MSESEDPRVPEGAENPPTPERPAGGPDESNQPPPPPPESDPSQEYDPGDDVERPSTNDEDRPAEDSAS